MCSRPLLDDTGDDPSETSRTHLPFAGLPLRVGEWGSGEVRQRRQAVGRLQGGEAEHVEGDDHRRQGSTFQQRMHKAHGDLRSWRRLKPTRESRLRGLAGCDQ